MSLLQRDAKRPYRPDPTLHQHWDECEIEFVRQIPVDHPFQASDQIFACFCHLSPTTIPRPSADSHLGEAIIYGHGLSHSLAHIRHELFLSF